MGCPYLYAELEQQNADLFLNEEIAPHPKLVSGQLPNGLRYYLLPHCRPENRISLRLYVNAGSFMEDDNEDGMAHFIEHMAFNGSKHFPPGTLIKYFQRIGMGFGNDTNAATGRLSTVYQLELPKNGPEEIDQGLTVLRDQAGELHFLPEEIQREKGVILSELRTRDSADYRSYKAEMNYLFPQHLFSSRFTIGTKESIESFRQDDFFRFYNRWYNPDRMAVIAVGDFDLKDLEVSIKKHFESLKKASQQAEPHYGTLSNETPLSAGVFHDKELTLTNISLSTVHPLSYRPNTLEQYRQAWLFRLVRILLHYRGDELINKPNSPVVSTSFSYGSLLNQMECGEISFSCNGEHWSEVLTCLEKFFRQVSAFGFLEQEIALAKKELRQGLENNVKNESTEYSSNLADKITDFLEDNLTYPSAQQLLDYYQKIEPTLTAHTCLEMWKKLWSPPLRLWLSGNFKTPPTSSEVLNVFNKSEKQTIEAPEVLKDKRLAYTYFGQPGEILDGKKLEAIQTECFRFKNNVRVTLKQTDFDKNQILVNVRIGSGILSIGNKEKPGLDKLISASFVAGGLKKHSANTLNQLMAGKTVYVDCDVEDDALALKGRTTPENLRDQLNLLCAYVCEPGYRNEGLEQFQKSLKSWYDYFTHTPEGVLKSQVPEFLTNGDKRFGYPEKAILKQRNFEEAAEILDPILKNDYMEITILGDINRDETLKALAETFGALPLRAEKKQRFEEERKIEWPSPHETKIYTFDSKLDRALIQIIWPTEGAWNVENVRKLNLLGEILENRLMFEIREGLGEAYSPKVSVGNSETFVDRGAIAATLLVNPKKARELIEKMIQIGDEIANKGCEQDELDRAKKPLLTSLKDTLKTNRFWMGHLYNIHEYPQKSEWPLTVFATYSSMEAEHLRALAKKYLTKDKAIRVLILPVGDKKQGARRKRGKSH